MVSHFFFAKEQMILPMIIGAIWFKPSRLSLRPLRFQLCSYYLPITWTENNSQFSYVQYAFLKCNPLDRMFFLFKICCYRFYLSLDALFLSLTNNYSEINSVIAQSAVWKPPRLLFRICSSYSSILKNVRRNKINYSVKNDYLTQHAK